jgi:hypothetical protein
MEELVQAETDSELRGLHRLLVSWADAQRDYCRAHPDDNAWWYNERASLSTLAGAAWRLKGWTALEEFSTSKLGRVPESGVDSGKLKKGRCDLYVAHGSSGFAVEAKHAWQSIGARSNGKDPNVLAAVEGARNDASCVTRNEGDKRLALTFVVPYVPLDEVLSSKGTERKPIVDARQVRTSVEKWLGNLRVYQDAAAKACFFPAECGNYWVKKTRRVFPGIALIVQTREKWRRRSK